jgi:hypothetical protein
MLEWYNNGYWHKWGLERHEKITRKKMVGNENNGRTFKKKTKKKKKAWQKKQKEASVLLYTSDLILVPTSCDSLRLYSVVFSPPILFPLPFSLCNFNSWNY